MPKWVKWLLGLALVPVCAGAALALGRVVRASGDADTTWVPLAAGAVCWILIFAFLPRPMWLYVVGHELTHALWTWMFGGQVRQFRASARGGHVVVTRHNFLIGLAPYFFPIYAVGVVLVFAVGHWIWNWTPYQAWFHLFLGAAYAFHITLTAQVLQTRQTDITEQGYLFSAAVIFLGNALVLLLGIPLLAARVSLVTALGWWLEETGELLRRAAAFF